MTQTHDHDPENLYEPFRQFSFPWLGIFGHIHPYPNFLVFGIALASGVLMGGWAIVLSFTDGMEWLILCFMWLFGIGSIGVWGLYAAFARAAWMHHYERITGTKPVFGDPANKPPDFDNRGWFARRFLR